MKAKNTRRVEINAHIRDLDGVQSIAEVRKWLRNIEKQVPPEGYCILRYIRIMNMALQLSVIMRGQKPNSIFRTTQRSAATGR